MVAPLVAQCCSNVDVATTISRRNIIVFLLFWLLSHDLSFESGLFPCYVACRDFGFKLRPCFCSYCITSGRDFVFLVATLLVVFCLHRFQILSRDFKVMSRLVLMFISHLLVATSILCCNQFPFFNLYSRSRPHAYVATMCCSCLVACSPNCSKVVATLISSVQLFFRSRP